VVPRPAPLRQRIRGSTDQTPKSAGVGTRVASPPSSRPPPIAPIALPLVNSGNRRFESRMSKYSSAKFQNTEYCATNQSAVYSFAT
jgi:hypothetical protein